MFGHDPELFRGCLVCERRQCGQRWWATVLSSGSVRAQLLEQFEDAGVVSLIMAAWALPESIDEPLFWQIPITGRQHYAYQRDGSRMLVRSLTLLRTG